MRRSVWLVPILLIGIALRLAGSNHPLWLDEIWSSDIAGKLRSPLGVLTEPSALVDNNHPLNTFWLALLGSRQAYWIAHLPSLLAGIGTLWLIWIAAARRSISAAVWATSLAAVSFPLITFSDEARGYALAAFFGVLMFDQAERFLTRPTLRFAAGFFLCCVFGGLSHLLILHVYVGLAAMSVGSLWLQRASIRPLRSFTLLHTGPILFWLGYYALFVGRLKFGGGAPRWYLFQSVYDSLAGLVGWIGPLGWLPATLLILALIGVTFQLSRRRDPMALFIFVGCYLSPVMLIAPQWILSASPVPMASRYFLPLMPIVLVLFGGEIARHRWLTAVASGVLLLNFVNSVRFIAIGPGDGGEVMRTIVRADPNPTPILADHPLRTKLVLDFYARRLFPNQLIEVDELIEHAVSSSAKWLVIHGRGADSPSAIDLGFGRPFKLLRRIPAFGLSGYDFAIYRRAD